MITYKIITQELYDNLSKLSLDLPSQKQFLLQSNADLLLKLQQSRNYISKLELQLKEEKQKSHDLFAQITQLQSKFNEMSSKIAFQSANKLFLQKQNIETTILLENAIKQKNQILALNSNLRNSLAILESGIITLNQKNDASYKKQKFLQSRIQELNQAINTKNSQNFNLLNKIHQNQQSLESLKIQLQKNSQILEKVLEQYEGCKIEKLELEVVVQKFKDSPIPKLQQKITANQTWIAELTKTVNQLRQRCVELQMDRPNYPVNNSPNFPYNKKTSLYVRPSTSYLPPVVVPYVPKLSIYNQKAQALPQATQHTFFTNKSRFEQNQKVKYMTICKQLFQQFNTKLSKIQQQKKSVEEKFQSLKLRLNEYQYNQFRYKDKISLYLEKIQRYEKLTQKQQSEMEKLILEFDHELNNVVRIKEQEIRSKLQEEVSKYQIDLQKLKQEEEITKKLEEQAYRELINHQSVCDNFEYEMVKQLLEQTESQLAEKQSELQSIKDQLNKKCKELQKYKQSKQSYKQKALSLQEECYNNSTEIRRLKSLLQELIRQLQSKSDQNLILKSSLQNRNHNLTERSNEYSRLRYGEEFNQNLSGKVSLSKNVSAGKRSESQKFEYQFSQIDVQLQRRNDMVLNQIVMKTKQQFQSFVAKNAAEPSRISQHSDQIPNSEPYWTRELKSSIKDSLDSISRSQISSQSQTQEIKSKDYPNNSVTNSPHNSNQSKNQTFGMRSLYGQKQNLIQNWGNKFLQHKYSLQ